MEDPLEHDRADVEGHLQRADSRQVPDFGGGLLDGVARQRTVARYELVRGSIRPHSSLQQAMMVAAR